MRGLRPAESRTLRAFAEAMAPGAAGMPRAQGPDEPCSAETVDVAPTLSRYLSRIPARQAALARAAIVALELAPFPRRFSRMTLAQRTAFLERLERSERWAHGELLLVSKMLAGFGYGNDARVRAAAGYESGCRVSGRQPAPPAPGAQPLGELEPQGEGEECDVAIVGSGAGGAVAAAILAEAGLDVLVLEAGPYLDRRTYPEEPLEALRSLYRDGGLTVAEGLPAIPTPVGRAVGGTTVINSGTCFRAPDGVLARWRQRHGVAWATDLDPDYAEGEEMMHVRPVDPERMGRNGQLLMEGAEALGLAHEPLHRNAGRCESCSSCPQGCRLDAKRAMHVSYLPRAVAAGARVRAGVEARRLVIEGGRARGVQCIAGVADGAGAPERPFTVRARRAVICSGGAFGTPELLLRSRVSSPSGQLGRNLRIHPACWVGASFDEEVRGWDGVMQSYAVTEWEPLGVLLEATFTPLAFGGQWLPGVGGAHQGRLAAFGNLASTGVHLSDTSSGRVRLARDGGLRVTYRLNRQDARRLAFGIARAAEVLHAAGAREVFPQIAGYRTLDRASIDRLDLTPPPARHLRLEAFHPLGTARMDADPALGVVGPDGAVHGLRDLYVADASVFPSSIGVNPMMTIVAMAARIARGLGERLGG